MPTLLKSPRNKFEKAGYSFLTKKKAKFEYETKRLPYVIEGYYVPDFILLDTDIYIEFKGHFRPEAKRKMVAVKKMHPNLDIRFVFYSYRKEYCKWCEKHGFPYAIGSIPNEWLKKK